MQSEYDLVIIGSGAGGAPIAHELARKGKSVLMLEKGPLLVPQYQAPSGISGFRRDEAFSTGTEKILHLAVRNKGASYYSSHVEPDLNDEPHVYRRADGYDDATIEGYTAQVVGGGTQLYGGVSLRFTPRDLTLAQWNTRPGAALDGDPNDEVRRAARDWPFPYATLEPYYAKAEMLVGINGTAENQNKPFASGDQYQKPLAYNPISEHVKTGMNALGMPFYRTPLAVITTDHAPSGRKGPQPGEAAKTAYVNRYGDPMGFKSSTWVSLLSPSLICRRTVHASVRCTSLPPTERHAPCPAASSSSPAQRSRACVCSSCRPTTTRPASRRGSTRMATACSAPTS
jgi:choline dehydrogenase-like flavoprotein